MDRLVSTAASVYEFDLYCLLHLFMIRDISQAMILGTHLHMDKLNTASRFEFVDFMIRFIDFIFLSLSLGQNQDTWLILHVDRTILTPSSMYGVYLYSRL